MDAVRRCELPPLVRLQHYSTSAPPVSTAIVLASFATFALPVQFAFHLVRALSLDQFTCRAGSSFACQNIVVATPMGPAAVPTTQFVYTSFGATEFASRWEGIGIAAAIWVGFLGAVFATWRLFNHQKR